ncbi:MAG: hypothetical protein AAB354_17375 [candidate division KSB1 bacterium]
MKALSIRQPWAWAVAHAGKDVENRNWHMRYHGSLAIHAAKSMTRARSEAFLRFWNEGLEEEHKRRLAPLIVPRSEELPRGAIIAVAEAIDCVHKSDSRWFAGPHGLLLRDVRVLVQPIPCRGALGFFELPAEIAELIAAQL